MPRITRAALRSNAVALDECEGAASVPLPPTPSKERAPLGEVAGNTVEIAMEGSNNDDSKPKKKRSAKGKNRQGARKAKKADPVNNEVLDDDSHSATSSAVEDACEELRKDPKGTLRESECESLTHAETDIGSLQVILQDEPFTPSSFAMEIARNRTPQLNTTQMDPPIHDTGMGSDQKDNKAEDSFVNVIETRTPVKLFQAEVLPEEKREQLEVNQQDNEIATDGDRAEAKEDSFVDQIVTRSPAKPVMRIEDSVEAIDAFEDEIEKVGEQIPAMNGAVSSSKTRKQKAVTRSSPRKSRSINIVTSAKGKGGNRQSAVKPHMAPPNNTAKPSLTRGPNAVHTKATTRVSSIHKAPFQPTKSTKPPTVSCFELSGDAVARKLKEQREARLGREGEGETKPRIVDAKGFKPVRSTKPPTRASFELPGEAVARKLKEKREERLKQQQDAEVEPKKKKEFKARPVRLSQAPMVTSTMTSRARMSLAQGETLENQKPTDSISNNRAGSRVRHPLSVGSSDATRRLSTLSIAKRSPTAATNPSARPSLAGPTTSRMSTATPSQRTTSNGTTSHQTLRGKEVFERNKIAKDELERVRKEKEEAAKRARAEAAERGRIASRQWAEKQKAKKASAEKGSGEGQPAATAA